uniref:hypothetical protein n=1 Tax=Staphylococcus epidermidis TaxID=1282 RepID=UPI001C9310EF
NVAELRLRIRTRIVSRPCISGLIGLDIVDGMVEIRGNIVDVRVEMVVEGVVRIVRMILRIVIIIVEMGVEIV